MKKFFAAGFVAAALVSAPAFAADLPVKAPAYQTAPAPIFNWTGFYAGIEGGGGWARESFEDNSGADVRISHKPSGGIFGGQAGYRWQGGQFVFGLEVTGAWADLKSTINFPGGIT